MSGPSTSTGAVDFVFWFIIGVSLFFLLLITFLMIAVGIYLLIFKHDFNHLKNYFFILIGFIVGWSPFLLFELRHGFPNFRSFYRFIFFGEETGLIISNFFSIITDVVFRLFNRLVANNQSALGTVILILSLSIFFIFWWKEKKKPIIFKTLSLLGIWLIIGVGLFGFYQKGIYDYYFGFMFPLPFLLTAFVLEKVSQKKLGLCLVSGVVLCLVVVNLKGVPFRYPPNRQLAQTEKIARFILDQAKGRPFNLALITSGNSDHAYRYFLELWGNPPITIENSQVDPERKTVTDQLFVICESLPCSPLGHSLWEIAGFGRAEIVAHWSFSVVEIYQLKHWQGEE